MAGSGEVLATQVALQESNDDTFGDDPRDGKKKKFKPFQKMRNFFRGGSSKKRFKVEEGTEGTIKSQSTGALHSQGNNIDDDEDDGGFGRSRKSGLAGSRSISEDSIFKPEVQKEAPAPVGVLAGKAVSMERINSNFQSELFSKLRSRQSDSDIDEGLPYSPNPNSYIFDAAMKERSNTIGSKSMSLESDRSLISVDGSEENLFDSNWTSGVASVKKGKTASTGSTESLDNMEVSDFEAIQMRTGQALRSDAAKHRISVKPKARRLSSKKSFKAKEKPTVQTNLPDVKEEPTQPSHVRETKQEDQTKGPAAPHKTVISTTISVGNPPDTNVSSIPRSDPKEIPQPRKERSDYDPGRMSRSMSPLSTSPVSQAALQDVKLRPRPLSGKFEQVDTKKEEGASELSAAFNKAKRFSRKYDSEGKIIDSNSESVKPIVNEGKPVVISKTDGAVNKMAAKPEDTKRDVTVSVLSSSGSKDSTTTTGTSSPTSPSGMSYILKKEPLRPASKPAENPVKMDKVKQVSDNTSTSISIGTKADDDTTNNKSVTMSKISPVTLATQSSVNEQTSSLSSSSPKTGSPVKLSSPRDEYRLKRQSRSKTLPVSKELVDKAEEMESRGSIKRPNRACSPPAGSPSITSPYENVVISPKPVQPKRMSWASSTGTTTNAEPFWIKRDKQRGADIEKLTETVKTDSSKEVKVEVKNNIESKPESTAESKTFKASEATEAKSSVEKSVGQPVKSWAKTVTAKPYEKPVTETTPKPLIQSSTVKSFSQSLRGNASTQSSSPKPPVPSSAKPLSQTVRPAFDTKATNMGTASKNPVFERSLSQKTGVNKPVVEAVKPVPQSTVKPLANINPNNPKPDNKDTVKPSVSSMSDSRKMFLNQENKKIESESKKDVNSSPAKSVFDRPKVGGVMASSASKSDTNAGVPEWKKALYKKTPVAMTQQVNIEIIDKEPEKKKPEVTKSENKVEEKPVAIREKPKTAPEKCSDSRSSKVLDLVKNFQNLKVT